MKPQKKNLFFLALAIPMLLLWLVLQGMADGDPESLAYGIAGAAALVLLGLGWQWGNDPEKPLPVAAAFTLAGLLSPALVQKLCYGWVEWEEILPLLIYLFPIPFAVIIGHFTRKSEMPKAARVALNGMVGFIFTGFLIGIVLAVRMEDYDYFSLVDAVTLAIFVLVTMLSACTEAVMDDQRRRQLEWSCWRVTLLLLVLMWVFFSGDTRWHTDFAAVFTTSLRLCLPLLLWRWRQVTSERWNRPAGVLAYFAAAFVLVLLTAEVYPRDFMGFGNFISAPEWMVLGVVLAIAAFFQRPGKRAVGAVCSLALAAANTSLTVAGSQRVRDILSGWEVIPDLDRLFPLHYAISFHSGEEGIFPELSHVGQLLFFAMVALVLLTALLVAVRTEKRSAGRLLALWLALQTAVFTAEELLGFARTVGAPFVGSCLAAFVVAAWVLKPNEKPEEILEGEGA